MNANKPTPSDRSLGRAIRAMLYPVEGATKIDPLPNAVPSSVKTVKYQWLRDAEASLRYVHTCVAGYHPFHGSAEALVKPATSAAGN